MIRLLIVIVSDKHHLIVPFPKDERTFYKRAMFKEPDDPLYKTANPEMDALRQRVAQLEAMLERSQADTTADDTENQFFEKLKTLNEINIQLNRAESFDELCFQGIKLGIERLGFDRLGLWFVEDSRRYLCGTFGVDEYGNIRDERDKTFNYGSDSVLYFSTGGKQAHVNLNASLFNDRSEVVGKGWHIAVPLLDGEQFVGFMSADNFINRRSMLGYQPELLQLYGSTIGYLAKSKQENETIRKLRQAIQQSSSMVILCNVAGTIEYVNPAFTAVSGYALEAISGNGLEFLVSRAGQADQYPQLWAALSAGTEWHDEWHNQSQTGEFYDTLVSISPVKNSEGHIVHFVMVQEDITERRQREAQEIALKIEREQVNLLRQFIADIAHEFKTPLAIINTKSYLIRRSLGEAAPAGHIAGIEDQVRQINMMLDDMLTMMRLGQAVALEISLLDLNSIIRQEIEKLAKEANRKHIQWVTDFAELPLLQADRDRLAKALHEVFDNAVTFTEAGGLCHRQHISAGKQCSPANTRQRYRY